MRQIDDFFRENLANKGLKYNDSYWESMEELLDEKSYTKPKWFHRKRLLVLALLITTLSISIGVHNFNKKTPPRSNTFITNSKNDTAKLDSHRNLFPEGNTNPAISESASKHTSSNCSIPVNNATAMKTIQPYPQSAITNLSTSIKSVSNPFPFYRTNSETPDIITPPAIHSKKATTIPVLLNKQPLSVNVNLQTYQNTVITSVSLPLVSQNIKLKAKHCLEYFIGAGYEFDQYNRVRNGTLLKKDEQTLNRSGFNVFIGGKRKFYGLKSGFGLMQLSEKTNYVEIEQTFAYSTRYKMVNPNFGTTPGGTRVAIIRKETDTLITSNEVIKNPNNIALFTYMKIPILATIDIKYLRFMFFIDAGLNTAFLIQRKGTYTSFENNRFKLVAANSSSDFNTILLQTYTSLGIKYKITNNLRFYAAYGYTQTLNSMTKSYIQKPTIKLVTTGLEINLKPVKKPTP